MNFTGSWIWTSEEVSPRNTYVRFRRSFEYTGGTACLRITADSRYVLYVNGEYAGQGPVRAWTNHWRYDTYNIEPYLVKGKNTIAVLVNHYGEGTFQYNLALAGLMANVELEQGSVATDSSWLASPDTAYVSIAPRISVQEPFEEQFDGRNFDGWTSVDYDDSSWKPAAELRPAADGIHNNLEHRGIPFLTQEPVLPKRIVSKELVKSLPYRFTVNLRQYLVPGDFTSNYVHWHGYLATQVWSPEDGEIYLTCPHMWEPAKVNGVDLKDNRGKLKAGWNSLVLATGANPHTVDYHFCIDGPDGLRFSCTGDKPGSTWALVGPFGLNAQQKNDVYNCFDDAVLTGDPRDPSATCERGEKFWAEGDVSAVVNEPFFQQIRPEHLPLENIFIQAYTDKVVGSDVKIGNETAILSDGGWATIYPDPNGNDVRVLVDFGDELLAFHSFDVDASEGTIIDFHNFEFIQPDGRYNYAEGMNNSFRYICREGRQNFRTFQHRGFRYSYVIFRNMTGPVNIKGLQAIFNSYPQSNRGSFASSDAKLDRIWKAGAQSLRCCSEDTYTDCPTYEQTHWVGDARNEALIDWAVNGDPRLWYRCIEQTGQSLERSPITESHVPSAWQNILPAWSFLWMRSCVEYYQFTGDKEKSLKLLDFIETNVEGIVKYRNDKGLFEIRAWNLFDWADMDTPTRGIVTHNNCFAVQALRETAGLARILGRSGLADKWEAVADSLSDAVNKHLWNEEKQAYTDCMRGDEQSKVFSQQTQTAAYMSGVAKGDRAKRCRQMMHNPPDDFVKAGSPFFEFFLLEAYTKEGKEQEFLDTIRRDWGFMIDMGATTFWEMWSGRTGRLTRSHCHAWSAAPTFFLSNYVLGVRPGGPGFAPAIIEPHPGDLTWCRGTMPTPAGDIEVQWDNESGKPFDLRIIAPESIELKITLPRKGTATVNGKVVKSEVR